MSADDREPLPSRAASLRTTPSLQREGDIIELRGVTPDGDIACDTTIATPAVQAELRAALERGIRRPVRQTEDGVEVTFTPDSWDDVMRYIEIESGCCPFLDLAARRADDAVVLRVSGRPEARDFIRSIFSGDDS